MGEMKRGLTDDHGGELEALLDRLSVDLIGEICKPNEAGQVWVRLGTGIRGWAHAWSFLRTAAGMPGPPGVAGFSPYSDIVAVAVAAVDGEDECEQSCDTGRM